jgi:hypothetical protein
MERMGTDAQDRIFLQKGLGRWQTAVQFYVANAFRVCITDKLLIFEKKLAFMQGHS